MERTCSDCKKTLPLTEENFFRRSGRATLQSYCKACHRRRNARWAANNPAARKRLRKPQRRPAGEVARLNALRRPASPWARVELVARHRAKTLGAPTFLTPAEKRRLRVYYHMAHLSGLTVDHIVALKDGGPHHPDNVQLMGRAENSRKGITERIARGTFAW